MVEVEALSVEETSALKIPVHQQEHHQADHKSFDLQSREIHVDGERVDGLYGIHNLEWLFGIARVLDVKYDSYGGRGFQARALCEAIEDALPNDSHIVDGVRKEA